MDTPAGLPPRTIVLTKLAKGRRVKALAAAPNVNVDDIGEVRKDGEHEYHLIYWIRQKATSYYKGTDLEELHG